MANNINIVISAQDKASRPIRAVADEMENASGRAGKFKDSVGRIRDVALGVYLPQLATNIWEVGKSALNAAGEYERSLNIFRSVSNATDADMQAVAQTARALGKDISLPGISAKDAALAMVELAKAGLSVSESLAASKGVLALAKAGQLDTAEAASIAANALNAFNMQGSEATRVADLLAGAANASSADVKDLAYGFQMASSSFASAKAPVDDLASALGLMANNGISGSDAGTSLKTMFSNLIPTTLKASNSMRDLKLDFYNAKGEFVGVRDLIRQLQDGTKGLTDEQRALHIENIFGADSSRAANILLKEGVEGYDAMSAAVNRTGAATDLAAAQNAGWLGALDSIGSALETISIDVGSKFLPKMTELALLVANNIEPAFNAASTAVGKFLPRIIELGKQVGEYLGPKLTALWQTVQEKLGPVLLKLWDEVIKPLSAALGNTLVVALGAVVDAANFLVPILSSVVTWMIDNKGAVLAFGVAVLAIGTAMRIGKFVTDFKTSLSEAKTAVGGLTTALGGTETKLSKFAGWGIFGTAAALTLGAITDDVAKANRSLDDLQAGIEGRIKSTEELKKKWKEGLITKDEYVKALNEAYEADKRAVASANDTAKKYDVVRLALEALPFGIGNAIKFNNNVNDMKGHASGTNASAGGWRMVGEHGPEPMFVPQGAEVTPSYRGRQGDSAGVSVTIQNYNSYNERDDNRFFRDLGFALELA